MTEENITARIREPVAESLDSGDGAFLMPERVLVCLSGSPMGGRVLRAGRQLATSLRADWTAVYVETPEHSSLSNVSRDRLAALLKQAESWGAETVVLPGLDIVTELLRYARAHGVTKIVMGKPARGRLREMLRPSLADALVRRAGAISVFIITSELVSSARWPLTPDARRREIVDYIYSLGAVAVATLGGLLLSAFFDPVYVALVYLVAVVLSANTWGLGPSILCSVASVLLLDALFLPPYGFFSISGPRDLLTLSVFLLVAFVISELGSRMRSEIESTRRREQEIGALYALSREIAFAQDQARILDAAFKQIEVVFGAEAVALLPDHQGKLQSFRPYALNSTELKAAQWAFDHREATGWGTSVFSQVPLMYLPLQTALDVFGVLGLRVHGNRNLLSPDRRRLLETIAGQVAMAIEHSRLATQAEQARLLEASDRFRNVLLSSISHDLRTPLASILGSVTSLLDAQASLEPSARYDLLQTIQEEATRLNRFVGNLLDITRIESGGMKPRRDWHSLEEVLGAALEHAGLDEERTRLIIAPALPLALFDFVLIEQVILNLIDNADKFSPLGAPIEISARQERTEICVRISDRGRGIPPGALSHIFEKFYRVSGDHAVPGTGLGLTICKGIIQAHGGTIWAELREGGGTTLAFTIPTSEMGGER